MGLVKGSAPWIELSDGVLDSDDQSSRSREGERLKSAASVETRADWALLFVLAAFMAVAFALVAWLMS